MNAIRFSLILAAASLIPAAARANVVPALAPVVRHAAAELSTAPSGLEHAAKRAARRPAAHPRKSPHHSAPRRHAAVHHAAKPRPTVRKPAVHHATTRAFRPHPAAVNRTRNTTVNRNTTILSNRRYARRGSAHRSYYSTRHSYTVGRYSHRSSRYSRRHVRRRNTGNQAIVQGIVDGTTGAAANGAVQVKLVPASTGRFRYGVAVNAPNNAKVRNYQVNNQTRYSLVTNARGGMRSSSFKQLAPGQPVLIMAPRGNNNGGNLFAQTIEMFPLK